mgnify:FL=1
MEKLGEIYMIKKYYDKFMVWQLHNRRELVFGAVGLIIGALIF